MPGDAKKMQENIDEKLKYIGLNLENMPNSLKEQVNLNYKVVKEFDNSSYKVYKYISVNDIEIFISPIERLSSLKEKYKLASHLSKYLEDKEKYIELIEALSNTDIEEIQKIEEEQNILNEKMPWTVKYKNAFKWQIYYSKNDNKYFMLVPLSEKDNAALFYLLKEKINCLNNNIDKKIYVPICDEEYSYKYLSKGQVSDIENYLWFFTKKWPSIYEVYDKQNNRYIQIVGKTNVYQGVESSYKIIIENNKEAEEKYKLMKALFIIASDLKFLYNFDSEVDDNGTLKFLFEEDELEFKDLEKFLKEQVDKKLDETKDSIEYIKELEEKLIDLKQENEKRNQEYTNKEKQIVMFLQCKKTFIGRFKYFFKTKKSKKKITLKGLEDLPKIIDFVEDDEEETKDFVFEEKDRYTIEDLLTICHISEKKETIYKDKEASIKTLEEKISILNKKIENADLYIQEIESHKRSIFEFWKFTNKDLPDAIAEAEKLKQEQKNKIKKSFNYQEDLQDLGKKMDEFQKNTLSKNEIDALYVVKDYIDIINILCKSEIDDEDNSFISNILANEKSNYDKQASEKNVIYFDIFGNIDKEPEKIKENETIEERKDKYQILHLDSKMKLSEFKETLNKFKRILEKEYNKIKLPCDISVYCLLNQNTMSEWSIANINPDNIIQSDTKRENIDIIKYNIPEGSSVLFYTNCILYKGNNTNIGINEDSETLLYLNKFDRELKGKLKRRVCLAKNEYENIVKSIKIYEYDLNPKEIKEVNNDK